MQKAGLAGVYKMHSQGVERRRRDKTRQDKKITLGGFSLALKAGAACVAGSGTWRLSSSRPGPGPSSGGTPRATCAVIWDPGLESCREWSRKQPTWAISIAFGARRARRTPSVHKIRSAGEGWHECQLVPCAWVRQLAEQSLAPRTPCQPGQLTQRCVTVAVLRCRSLQRSGRLQEACCPGHLQQRRVRQSLEPAAAGRKARCASGSAAVAGTPPRWLAWDEPLLATKLASEPPCGGTRKLAVVLRPAFGRGDDTKSNAERASPRGRIKYNELFKSERTELQGPRQAACAATPLCKENGLPAGKRLRWRRAGGPHIEASQASSRADVDGVAGCQPSSASVAPTGLAPPGSAPTHACSRPLMIRSV